MYDAGGTVIYVGKAKDLKKRLSSYFRSNLASRKTEALVALIAEEALSALGFTVDVAGSGGEALAAFGASHYVFPEKKVFLQYTTTSPKLHKVLGVETPTFDD